MKSECLEALKNFQTQYLFLMVGTNPLPNYVSAKLLLKQDEESTPCLVLVRSQEVQSYADTLSEVLKDENPNLRVINDIQIDEAEPWDIYSKIQKILDKLGIKESIDVGLNYTGGTKAMAVSAYRAIKDRYPDARLSYLDARSLSMIIEQPSQPSFKWCVRECFELKMETMLKLHRYRFWRTDRKGEQPPTTELQIPKTFEDLPRLIAEEGLINDLNQWMFYNFHCIKSQIDCESSFRNCSNNQRDKELKRRITDLPLRFDEDFQCLKGIFGEDKTFGDFAKRLGLEPNKAALYLDGRWLEDYVLICLKDIAKESLLHEIGMNLKAQPKDTSDPNNYFEIDNYAIRGYQLFAISCGTGAIKGHLKLKLYEILIHARQMGGDEARLALVCGSQDPDKIENELVQDWNIPEGIIHVFGTGEIPTLAKSFAKWFAKGNL